MEITAVMEKSKNIDCTCIYHVEKYVGKNVPVVTRPINQSFKRTPIEHTTLRWFGNIIIIGNIGRGNDTASYRKELY